jgi:hypothetical protein
VKSANLSIGPFVAKVAVAGSGLIGAIKGVENVPNGSVFALVGVADLEGLALDGDGVAFEFHSLVGWNATNLLPPLETRKTFCNKSFDPLRL